MTEGKQNSGNCRGAATIWTSLRCSRYRYVQEHPGPVSEGDLDRACGLCGAMLGAVTTYRVRPGNQPSHD